MTKFTGPSDIGFKRVTAQLRRWVEEVKSVSFGTQSTSSVLRAILI